MIAPLQHRQEPHWRVCQVSSERWQLAPRQRWSPYERPQMILWSPPTMHPRLSSGRPRWRARQARPVLIWPARFKTPRRLGGASPWPRQRASRAARHALTRRMLWTRTRSTSVTMSRIGWMQQLPSQVRGHFALHLLDMSIIAIDLVYLKRLLTRVLQQSFAPLRRA